MSEKQPKIYHKIEAGKKIRVFKSTYKERNYYKVQITQKEYDGTSSKYYINLQFKKGVELNDPDGKGVDIIINEAYENFRLSKTDPYAPVMYLMVTEFEVCEREEQVQAKAYADFQQNFYENEVGEEVEITDDFLD